MEKSGWCLFIGGHCINIRMEVECANCTVHRCARWLTRGSELWNHFREKGRCGMREYGTREEAVSGKRNNSGIEWEQYKEKIRKRQVEHAYQDVHEKKIMERGRKDENKKSAAIM